MADTNKHIDDRVREILYGNPKGIPAEVQACRNSHIFKYELKRVDRDFGRKFQDLRDLSNHISTNPGGLKITYQSPEIEADMRDLIRQRLLRKSATQPSAL